jgi:hypothetical protein
MQVVASPVSPSDRYFISIVARGGGSSRGSQVRLVGDVCRDAAAHHGTGGVRGRGIRFAVSDIQRLNRIALDRA